MAQFLIVLFIVVQIEHRTCMPYFDRDIMRKLSLLIPIAIAFTLTAFIAKAQVKSKSYGMVLKRLLSHKVPEISVSHVALSNNKYILLDARENEEFAVSHIPDAIHVGYKNFNAEAIKSISKDKPIVVYCSIGKRSENITERLMKQGYTNVSNLYGGIFEWMNQGQPVHDMENKRTDKVHAYNWIWGRFLEKGKKVY
jgi:rhodanese-related sulfurtransferase